MSDGLVGNWQKLLTALAMGAVLGGGGVTGMYQLGPGAELAREVRSNSENQIRLTGQLEHLIGTTDKLADKVQSIDTAQDGSSRRLDKLEYDLNAIKATLAQDLAAMRATQTENIARLDRELVKLSDKVDAMKKE